jgi:hypothetical protein
MPDKLSQKELGNELLSLNLSYISRLKDELLFCGGELDKLKQQISSCKNLKLKSQLLANYQKMLERYGVSLEKATVSYMASFTPLNRLLTHVDIDVSPVAAFPELPVTTLTATESDELTEEFLSTIYKKYED